jgi:hypothetical protein
VTVPADRGEERRFTPTSGTTIGWCGLALVAGVLVFILVDDRSTVSIRFALGVAMFGVLVWCYMLRPRLVIGPTEVELRNAFSSWHVPLADVRRVAVRTITRIYTDDGQYDGVAVGRSVRSLRRGGAGSRRAFRMPGLNPSFSIEDTPALKRPQANLDSDGVADFVTEQLLVSAERARDEGQAGGSTPYRTWAVPELTGLLVLAVGFAVSLAL